MLTAKVNLCTCNNCEGVFIDTNPQICARLYNIKLSDFKTLVNHSCPICKTDDFLTDEIKIKVV